MTAANHKRPTENRDFRQKFRKGVDRAIRPDDGLHSIGDCGSRILLDLAPRLPMRVHMLPTKIHGCRKCYELTDEQQQKHLIRPHDDVAAQHDNASENRRRQHVQDGGLLIRGGGKLYLIGVPDRQRSSTETGYHHK